MKLFVLLILTLRRLLLNTWTGRKDAVQDRALVEGTNFTNKTKKNITIRRGIKRAVLTANLQGD